MWLLTVREFIETRFKTDVIWALKTRVRSITDTLDKHVLPAMGDVRLRDVSTDHVQALVRKKFEAGYWSKLLYTQKCDHCRVDARQTQRAYNGDNPAQGIRLPEMQRKETHALSFDQGRDVFCTCQLLPEDVLAFDDSQPERRRDAGV